jgi:formylglycine-generating enzyme required for sulfatase activity
VLVSGSESGGNPAANDGGRERQELFISYSQKDRAFLEQFWVHLSPLEGDYGLRRWDDSRIQPGDIWLMEIEQALERAQVALLLVSPHFLASDFIRRKELPKLFEAANKDGVKILWLPIRPCSWKRYPQIEQYQSVGSINPTLSEMGEGERDREMVRITDRIHELFEQIGKERLAAREAAKAEAMALREEEEAKRQAEETAQTERSSAENEARAEAERWKAEAEAAKDEAERTRLEMERLAREKEELQRQASLKMPQPLPQPDPPSTKWPQLIQIPATRGWLVREGKEWRKQEEAIRVLGYREELAEGIALTMLQIPAGEFRMGSPQSEEGRSENEGPQHPVKLTSFFLAQTPVTQAQWKVVAGWAKVDVDLKPAPSGFNGANRPVENVSWHEAIEFCRHLSKHNGKEYTLPSEAQWEYACRAGTTTPFAFGDTLAQEVANYDGTKTYGSVPKGLCRQQTTDVGSFPANKWGLQDMHGNVWEWCLDHWHDNYNSSPEDGPAWLDGSANSKIYRVLRGGSWGSDPVHCRSACRDYYHPAYASSNFGFRVCCLPRGRFSSAL